jgi:hypothetical protein
MNKLVGNIVMSIVDRLGSFRGVVVLTNSIVGCREDFVVGWRTIVVHTCIRGQEQRQAERLRKLYR